MSPERLLAAYAEVAKKHGLPHMELAAVEVNSRDIPDTESAWSEFARFAPVEGWLQFQSHVVAFKAGILPAPEREWGVLLAAEAVNAASGVIQLRPNETGGLRLSISCPSASDDGSMDQSVMLADTVRHLGTEKAYGTLRYRRYWKVGSDIGPVPVLGIFQGYANEEED